MSRVAELLTAVAGVLRALSDQGARVFTEVRAELDRYDLSDLLKDSTRAPTARVCLLRAKPVRGADGRIGFDVSVGIIVVARREGRANPEFSSADLAALRLIDLCSTALMLNPNVSLGQISDVDPGDALVAMSEQSNDRGMAIALQEAKWRLHDVYQPRPAAAAAVALNPSSGQPHTVIINGVAYPVGSQP
ncbi:hypothetical protein [Camelimonas lactis]|uniref:Uncharacterized protein n=1 Tax=Camelimonas lactis TaxID=659006 RepID=A0A4R2GRD7_9HYPH|nr:hypothetical protein [Camelimonas lactis]TCO12439.1 hypothetical protein EV666_10986 [Camelimonas lactis]